MSENLDVWKRKFERERLARKQAETLLEEKSSQLFEANSQLEQKIEFESSISHRESTKFRELFHSSIDGILLYSDKGVIIDSNRSIQQLLGSSDNELNGEQVEKIYAVNQKHIYNQALTEIEKSGVSRFEAELQCSHGVTFPAEISTTRFEVNGQPIIQAIIRDITVAKEQQLDLQEATATALNASEAKSLFLATMSHEIRTPLNGILGFTDILLHGKVSAEQHSHLKIIQKSGDMLLNIINDILDFSRIESNQIELEHADFNLIDCIEETLDIQAQAAALKQVELLYFVNEDTPLHLNGDAGRLRQILLNLVSNGLKFTEQGSVIVKVECSSETTLQFVVSDTGIGFDINIQEQLFSAFQQADASTTRKYGGTGLGLAICKQLTETMGGTISARSEPNKGSQFIITLPLVEAIAPPPEPPSFEHIAGTKILVVDDHPTNLKFMQAKLGHWNCSTTLVNNADEALKTLKLDPDAFDLLLIDMLMPDMDGIELATELQSLKISTPMVLVTSSRFEGENHKAQQAGFQRIIHKPVREKELLSVVSSLGTHGKKNKHKIAPQSTKQSATNKLNLHYILVVEDNAINAKLAKLVIERLGFKVHIAHNGQEAIISLTAKPIYDLVFMDMQMPIMDGLEATRQIRAGRAGNQNKNIPIIAMTANALKQDKAKCISAGMNDFIAKPIQFDLIEQIIFNYLDKIK